MLPLKLIIGLQSSKNHVTTCSYLETFKTSRLSTGLKGLKLNQNSRVYEADALGPVKRENVNVHFNWNDIKPPRGICFCTHLFWLSPILSRSVDMC